MLRNQAPRLRASELIPLVEQMAAETPDIAPGVLNGVLANAHVQADRTADARHLLDEFATADFDLPLDQVWLTGMVNFAEAAESSNRAGASFFSAARTFCGEGCSPNAVLRATPKRPRDLPTKARTAAAAHGYANVAPPEHYNTSVDRSPIIPRCPITRAEHGRGWITDVADRGRAITARGLAFLRTRRSTTKKPWRSDRQRFPDCRGLFAAWGRPDGTFSLVRALHVRYPAYRPARHHHTAATCENERMVRRVPNRRALACPARCSDCGLLGCERASAASSSIARRSD